MYFILSINKQKIPKQYKRKRDNEPTTYPDFPTAKKEYDSIVDKDIFCSLIVKQEDDLSFSPIEGKYIRAIMPDGAIQYTSLAINAPFVAAVIQKWSEIYAD